MTAHGTEPASAPAVRLVQGGSKIVGERAKLLQQHGCTSQALDVWLLTSCIQKQTWQPLQPVNRIVQVHGYSPAAH